MSEPAKDEAELMERVGEEIRKSFIQPGCCMEDTGCQIGPCFCSQEAGKAVLAAIRAAGWAVVPVEPTKEMLWAANGADWYAPPERLTWADGYRLMLAAAPGAKP